MANDEFWCVLTGNEIELIGMAIGTCIGIEGYDAIIEDLRNLRIKVFGALEHPRITNETNQGVMASE